MATPQAALPPVHAINLDIQSAVHAFDISKLGQVGGSAVKVRRSSMAVGLPTVHGRRFGLIALAPHVGNEDDVAGGPGAVRGMPPPRSFGDIDDQEGLEWSACQLLLPPIEDVVLRGFNLPHALYPYQIEGVRFLASRRSALLADDMGLGKTVQTIVSIRALLGSGVIDRALVVCPSGLKSNWKSEFNMWAPELGVQVIEGPPERREGQWTGPAHVLIANYECIRNDMETLPSHPLDLVVLDEAQRVKNAGTLTTRAINAIPRRAAWCLTGTPIENSLSDLTNIMRFAAPSVALPEDVTPEDARSRLAPLVLRRQKEDVLKDLPPKEIRAARLDLTDAQREAYDDAAERGSVYLQGLGETVTLQHVLALLTRLKQICNYDPATGESAKLDYVRESLESIQETGEKALLFSQYVNTLEFLEEELKSFLPLIYHGGMSRKDRDAVVEQFKASDDNTVLLISLQAGGVGLNLQAASYVYHFDRWWNPAIERQAEDRAYRLGQERPVFVTRLVMRDTIEDRIHQVLEEKRSLFERFVSGSSDGAVDGEKLSDGDYFTLVGLDPALAKIRRVGA